MFNISHTYLIIHRQKPDGVLCRVYLFSDTKTLPRHNTFQSEVFMLNFLWAGMLLVGLIYGCINGTITQVNSALLDSAKDAVTLCISMLGIMAFWTGLMAIARSAGTISRLEKMLHPLLRILFPGVPNNHPAGEYIVSNLIANFLGLGWAATPFGLKAMKELSELNPEKDKSRASNDMCTFLIINIASLQLIPVNVIAYRSQYGSVNPTATLVSGIIATFLSVLSGVLFAVIAPKIQFHNKRAV